MPYILAWLAIGGLIGGLIGQSKGRTGEGVIIGAFLGIIGWILLLLGPDQRHKCPQCKAAIPEDASVCMYCHAPLAVKPQPFTVNCPVCAKPFALLSVTPQVQCPHCQTVANVEA